MKIIRKISYKVAHYIAKELNDTHQNRHIYYFRLQTIFGESFKFILFLIIIYLLGIFTQGIAILIFFSLIRSFAGGYHMDNYTSCAVTSFAFLITFSFALKYATLPLQALIPISTLIFVITFYAVYKWAPQPAYPKTQGEMKLLKKISYSIVGILALSVSIFVFFSCSFLVQAACSGLFISSFFLSPMSEKLLSQFDR